MDISALREIGLSKPEIDVYIGLLEIGETKTGELCNHTHVPSSKIYTILDTLIGKGLVSYALINKIKYYQATPADSIKELFKIKQKELESKENSILTIIETLKSIQPQKEQTSKSRYFVGISGIKGLYLEILKLMETDQNSVLKIHSANTVMTKRLHGFYTDFHIERMKKKIKYQLILGDEFDITERANDLTQVRTKKIKNEIGWGVFGKYFFLNYNGGKEPYGVIISDPLTAQTFEMMFNELWDMLDEQ